MNHASWVYVSVISRRGAVGKDRVPESSFEQITYMASMWVCDYFVTNWSKAYLGTPSSRKQNGARGRHHDHGPMGIVSAVSEWQ
jgi:hypothetical protein